VTLTIDDGAVLHTLINTFVVAPERQAAVVASLREFTEHHARAMPGFVGASVHASLDGGRVINYVQWETAADLAAMLGTPEARAHMAEVGALAQSVTPVPYRVAYVGSQARARR
jgi:quinol monooxygenase YgiN